MTDAALLDFLENQLSDNRKALFKRVAEERTRHFTVALENVYQPHNASAVLRSCECFGIQDVHVIERENKFDVSSGVVKGADKWLDLHYYRDTENPSLACINHLKKEGYKVIAAVMHENATPLEEYDITQRSAFIFGTELEGLTPEAIAHADGFIVIPMAGFTTSFNVSVAAAITLHHLVYKLKNSNVPWRISEEEMLKLRYEWCVRSLPYGEKLVDEYYRRKRA
jgi:tRNA (guanosine-2'-O-)-methyltransferase